jgi:hypothetical protein
VGSRPGRRARARRGRCSDSPRPATCDAERIAVAYGRGRVADAHTVAVTDRDGDHIAERDCRDLADRRGKYAR